MRKLIFFTFLLLSLTFAKAQYFQSYQGYKTQTLNCSTATLTIVCAATNNQVKVNLETNTTIKLTPYDKAVRLPAGASLNLIFVNNATKHTVAFSTGFTAQNITVPISKTVSMNFTYSGSSFVVNGLPTYTTGSGVYMLDTLTYTYTANNFTSVLKNRLDSITHVNGIVWDGSYVHTDFNLTAARKNKLDSISMAKGLVHDTVYVHTANNFTTALKNRLDSITMVNGLVWDASYVHTDNNFTTAKMNKYDSLEVMANVVYDGSYNHTDNNFGTAIKDSLIRLKSVKSQTDNVPVAQTTYTCTAYNNIFNWNFTSNYPVGSDGMIQDIILDDATAKTGDKVYLYMNIPAALNHDSCKITTSGGSSTWLIMGSSGFYGAELFYNGTDYVPVSQPNRFKGN